MSNKFRKELEVELGEVKILLRPTMENLAALEEHAIHLQEFSYNTFVKSAEGAASGDKGKIAGSLLKVDQAAKAIYYLQAEADPSKRHSLEKIFDLMLAQGVSAITSQMSNYLLTVTVKKDDEPTKETKAMPEEQKKS